MIWYIGLGSGLGGMARYLLSGWVQGASNTLFPVGTLAVNVLGALAIGFLLRYLLDGPGVTPEVRMMLTIGFCGGITTFSTFSYETVALLQTGQWSRASLYAGASVALTVGATFAGLALAQAVLNSARQT